MFLYLGFLDSFMDEYTHNKGYRPSSRSNVIQGVRGEEDEAKVNPDFTEHSIVLKYHEYLADAIKKWEAGENNLYLGKFSQYKSYNCDHCGKLIHIGSKLALIISVENGKDESNERNLVAFLEDKKVINKRFEIGRKAIRLREYVKKKKSSKRKKLN